MGKKSIELKHISINEKQQLRVASLNMLNSAFKADERFEKLFEEVKELNPDVLHIQEANFKSCSVLLERLIVEGGFNFSGRTLSIESRNHDDRSSACFTLTKMNAKFESLEPLTNDSGEQCIPVLMSSFVFNNIPVFTFNVHLAWGGDKEALRLKQLFQVENKVKELKKDYSSAVFVIAGDFNAVEDSDSIRFLKGKTTFNGESSYWVDAWDMFGSKDNHSTSSTVGLLGRETAFGVGVVVPEIVPDRRIDYIMVNGWSYGHVGSPLNFIRWADSFDSNGLSVSDHFGVACDLLFL